MKEQIGRNNEWRQSGMIIQIVKSHELNTYGYILNF